MLWLVKLIGGFPWAVKALFGLEGVENEIMKPIISQMNWCFLRLIDVWCPVCSPYRPSLLGYPCFPKSRVCWIQVNSRILHKLWGLDMLDFGGVPVVHARRLRKVNFKKHTVAKARWLVALSLQTLLLNCFTSKFFLLCQGIPKMNQRMVMT